MLYCHIVDIPVNSLQRPQLSSATSLGVQKLHKNYLEILTSEDAAMAHTRIMDYCVVSSCMFLGLNFK